MNIGLSQRILHYKNRAYDCLEHGWFNLLSDHTLFSIPNNTKLNFAPIVKDLDLVIFTGGDASLERTVCETRLLTECYKQRTAALGVCHGAFFINQLEQGENNDIENHSDVEHTVTLSGEVHTVNSYHNIQIKQLGADLTPIAYSSDGSIEGFKHLTRAVWGLVWHPERMKEPVLPDDLRRFLNERNDKC